MMSQQDSKKPRTEERDKEVKLHESISSTKSQMMSMTKSIERRKQSELTLSQLLNSGGSRTSILSAQKERRTVSMVLTKYKSYDSESRVDEPKNEVNLDQNSELGKPLKSEIVNTQNNQSN